MFSNFTHPVLQLTPGWEFVQASYRMGKSDLGTRASLLAGFSTQHASTDAGALSAAYGVTKTRQKLVPAGSGRETACGLVVWRKVSVVTQLVNAREAISWI